MKRNLIALAFAMLATTAQASVSTTPIEGAMLDRSLPTYPELGDAGRYLMDAGKPTDRLVVQDYGSA